MINEELLAKMVVNEMTIDQQIELASLCYRLVLIKCETLPWNLVGKEHVEKSINQMESQMLDFTNLYTERIAQDG